MQHPLLATLWNNSERIVLFIVGFINGAVVNVVVGLFLAFGYAFIGTVAKKLGEECWLVIKDWWKERKEKRAKKRNSKKTHK